MREHARVIPAGEYRRDRWKNGLGWTREIMRAPDGDAWHWRLSIAEIECDAAFSSFPGIERELVLLQGNGLRLRFADEGRDVDLAPPHGRLRFPGEAAVEGTLVTAPPQDFNLMWRPDAVAAELLHRPLAGPMLFFTEPDTTWAVYLLAGRGEFDAESGLPPLQAGDTAILSSAGERQRFTLRGAGELLAVCIRPHAASSSSDEAQRRPPSAQ